MGFPQDKDWEDIRKMPEHGTLTKERTLSCSGIAHWSPLTKAMDLNPYSVVRVGIHVLTAQVALHFSKYR
jgi:hypothetical protein